MKFYTGIGSRNTPKEICEMMTRMAVALRSQGYTLRSGGADGADLAFEAGAGDRKDIFIPWKGFNGSTSHLFPPTHEAMQLAARYHPAWDFLKYPTKLIMGRNSHQVLGPTLDLPSDFIFCWTREASGEGGTGQALRIAKDYHIPVFDLGGPIGMRVARTILSFLKEPA